MQQDFYRGWIMPPAGKDIDGNILERHYGNRGTKSEFMEAISDKLPKLMEMNDGRPVNKALWTQRRRELLDIVSAYGFGYTPDPPKKVSAEILWDSSKQNGDVLLSYAGKAVSQRIMLTFDATYGEFSFPIQFVRPIYAEKRPPVIVHLDFSPSIRDLPLDAYVDGKYAPIEEIIDNGFAYAKICYNDIIVDDVRGDFEKAFAQNGMGKVFFRGNRRQPDEWGKIGMWAYAASRVLDYLLTRDDLDHNCISVAGHSRLGKTALWCAAQDERFFAALVNDSGYGGAGLMHSLPQNRMKVMVRTGFIDWWNERMKDYVEAPTTLPYDAHFMVACVAPRYINLVAADGDEPLYQLSDFMSAVAASPAFEINDVDGFIAPEELPHSTVIYNEGHIGYGLRPGTHYFSRWDWNVHMQFIKKHRKGGTE